MNKKSGKKEENGWKGKRKVRDKGKKKWGVRNIKVKKGKLRIKMENRRKEKERKQRNGRMKVKK